jgi:hypothetical protein
LFFGGGDQRGFDSLEDDLLVDVLIAMDGIDDPQNLVRIHKCFLHPSAAAMGAERFRIVGSVIRRHAGGAVRLEVRSGARSIDSSRPR